MIFRISLLLYGAALMFELSAFLTEKNEIHLFSKPALMLILIFYFAISSRKFAPAKFLILAALIFSWLGDVFLLFDKIEKSYFIYGLSSFLLAHISYIFYFLLMRKINGVRKIPNVFLIAGIVVYVLVFLGVLAANVNNLFIPLTIYALIISVMLIASLSAFAPGENIYGKICVAGTFLFVVSDSILAITRFVAPLPLAPFFIMLTYAAAQFLIVEGSLRNLREIEKTRTLQN
jgi:uncharacterized membrane protein YhhN